MDVYLMQHGEAVPAEVDPDRPLSDLGRHSVEVVGARAAACGVRIDRIVHSGKLRAEQTATILADAVGCSTVERVAGLSPNDAVETVAERLANPAAGGSIAVVGHLPSLDKLASLLVAGNPSAHVVAVRNGGLVKLVPKPVPGPVPGPGPGPAPAPGLANPLGPTPAGRPSSPSAAFSVSWVLTPEVAGP